MYNYLQLLRQHQICSKYSTSWKLMATHFLVFKLCQRFTQYCMGFLTANFSYFRATNFLQTWIARGHCQATPCPAQPISRQHSPSSSRRETLASSCRTTSLWGQGALGVSSLTSSSSSRVKARGFIHQTGWCRECQQVGFFKSRMSQHTRYPCGLFLYLSV